IIEANNGLGYKVFLSEKFLAKQSVTDSIAVFTHNYIREDAQDLYGFASFAELQLFELLLSVSGVGPKAGLAILAGGDPESLRQAIAAGDSTVFTKVSGIGAKTAERIILDLQSKVDSVKASGRSASTKSIGTSAEALAALENLGYTESEARDLLREVNAGLKVEDQIKAALKKA
ncbi:Holliday junction branch migration protein RuvA, partial [Patescibacteria group bacterium]